MAYKRYFYKNGKVFGPYYYESYRDETGKVRKKYVGLVDPNKNSKKEKSFITPTVSFGKKSLIVFAGIIFLISLFFLIFSNLNLTGNVGLNANAVYFSGENLSGEFVLQVKEGELIPANAKFVVEQSGKTQEFLISDLLEYNSNGSFYVEGKTISGSGSGYGILGEKKIYPEINFELIIFDSENFGQRTIPENNFEQASKETKTDVETETPQQETQKQESEIIKSENSETNSELGQREISKQNSEIPSESQSELSEVSITGAVVEEFNENVLKGKCSKEKDFVYEIPEGKTAKIKSVELNGEPISDENVKLKISGNQIIVSTDYSEIETGFGEEYLTSKENKIKINLKDLNLKAEQGELVIKIVYENEILAEAKEIIEVKEIPNENETETETKTPEINQTTEIPETNKTENSELPTTNEAIVENETIENLNETENKIEIPFNETIISNETIFNKTIENKTRINLTAEVFTTIQYPAVINKPVKWMKFIEVNNSNISDFVVEIPKTAENISVKRDDEVRQLFEESQKQKPLERNLFLTGNVISEELQGAEIIETTDKKIINLTGVAETSQQVAVEYFTEAPKSEENETGNKKQILISAPDELNYTNILAYTLINENYKIKINDARKLKLYWIVKTNKTIETPSVNETNSENETSQNQTQEINQTINETETLKINETIIENKTEISIENETEIIENETEQANQTEEDKIINKTESSKNETETPSVNQTFEENETETPTTNESFEGSRFITGQVIGNGNAKFFIWLKNIFAKISWSLTGNVIKIVSAEQSENFSEINSTIIVEEIEKILVNYTAYDLDNDSYVDYIEWNVPHLSNQTYELIIEISKAEHLDSNKTFLEDVYEFVKTQDNNFILIPSGNYLRVTFEKNLTKEKDITIYARGNNLVIVDGVEVPYEIYEKKKRIDEIKKILGGNE